MISKNDFFLTSRLQTEGGRVAKVEKKEHQSIPWEKQEAKLDHDASSEKFDRNF